MKQFDNAAFEKAAAAMQGLLRPEIDPVNFRGWFLRRAVADDRWYIGAKP